MTNDYGCIPSTAPSPWRASARISPAPPLRSCLPTCAPSALASDRDPLAGRRHARRDRERQRNAGRETETPQAGGGKHQRVVPAGPALIQPAQAGVEVTANRREACAGKQTGQLRDAADATGADRR